MPYGGVQFCINVIPIYGTTCSLNLRFHVDVTAILTIPDNQKDLLLLQEYTHIIRPDLCPDCPNTEIQ